MDLNVEHCNAMIKQQKGGKMNNFIANGEVNAKNISIGLSIPVFIASILTLFIGAPVVGLIGTWGFLVWGEIVPLFIKNLHAYLAFSFGLIVISSLIMPSLNLKPLFRKTAIVIFFLFAPLYSLFVTLHFTVAEKWILNLGFGELFVSAYGIGAFLLDILFFSVILLISLLAAGIKIPFLTSDSQQYSKYNLRSEIQIPRIVFLVYAILVLIAFIVGLYNILMFYAQLKPVSPAALVSFHSHIGIFAMVLVMGVLTLKAVGADDKKITIGFRVATASVILTFFGFLGFILLDNMPSGAWIGPAKFFFLFMVFVWLGVWGIWGLKPSGYHFTFVRTALIFSWTLFLLVTSLGPWIGMRYATERDLTVTFYQEDQELHIGPFPDPKPRYYPGTAPDRGTPRGLEDFHLSVSGWLFVANFWLLTFLIFGDMIFPLIKKPNLIFFLSVIITLAPFLNAIGRTGTYLGWPDGRGPLILAGHPIKTFTIVFLTIICMVLLKKLKK
jgi:hypothetical protein